MYITARERRILNIVLSPYKNASIKSLSSDLGVSERTIRRDLIKLDDTLKQFDLEMRYEGELISIQGTLEQKKKIISMMDYVEYTKYERLTIILSLLIEEDDYTKLYTIAAETNTNTHICTKDLDLLEAYLMQLDAQISRKRGLGVKIDSKEGDLRKIIFRVVRDYLREFYLIPVIEGKSINAIIPVHMHDKMNMLIDFNQFNTYIEMIEIIFGEEKQYISDDNIIDFALMINIMMKRIDDGHPVEPDIEEFFITNKIATKFNEELSLSKEEQNYFANILAKYIQFELFVNYDFELRASVTDMINEVSQKVGYNFSNDYKMYSELITHIDRRIKEIDHYNESSNPVIEEIINEYFEFFKVLKIAVKNSFDYPFTDVDIGYFMLYFISKIEETQSMFKLKVLVVCAGGMGTSKMLLNRLKTQFLNISPINTSVSGLKEFILDHFDIIISSVHLDLSRGDYIMVSPLLLDQDTSLIRKEIRRILYRKLIEHKENEEYALFKSYSEEILENFNIQFFKLECDLTEKEAILNKGLEVLLEKGYISDRESVLSHIIKREKLGGLGVPGTECILYHTRMKDILKPSMTFIYLDSSQHVKAMTGDMMEVDTYLMMLSPEELDELELKIFNLISTLLIRDHGFVDQIRSKDLNSIKTYIINKVKEVS